MGLTAHEAAVVAGAKALHEAGVVGDRMALAETVVSALAADPEVRAALEWVEAALDDTPYRPGAAADVVLAALA